MKTALSWKELIQVIAPSIKSTVLSHENSFARSFPFAMSDARRSLSSNNLCNPFSMSSTEFGSTRSAASPATSLMLLAFEVSTGTPRVIASRTGRPNPSLNDGKASSVACANQAQLVLAGAEGAEGEDERRNRFSRFGRLVRFGRLRGNGGSLVDD